MTPIMGLLLGAFVFLIGAALTSNAAFADRATFGFWVAVVGAVMVIAAVLELMFKTGGV